MKGTVDTNETTSNGSRRGLFRRGRRATDQGLVEVQDRETGDTDAEDAVATVDSLTRRIDDLTAPSAPALAVTTAGSTRSEFDMSRVTIAHANDVAATTGDRPTSPQQPAPEAHTMQHAPAATPHTAPEPVYSPEPVASASSAEFGAIQARVDAVLAPSTTPAVQAAPVGGATLEAPAAELRATEPVQAQAEAPVPVAAAPAPPTAPTPAAPVADLSSAAPNASRLLGIDVQRMVELLEDEAQAAQSRIEMEMHNARTHAGDVVDRAEDEAERIREHGQAQARVLLSEVEEIISEAQQTGEQILHRANEEAGSLRGEATNVLHQAETEARAIVETARREGEQVLAEQRRLATVRAQEAMREQDRLKDQIRRLEERRRQVLESLEPLISQLTQMMPATMAASTQASSNVVPLDRTGQSH